MASLRVAKIRLTLLGMIVALIGIGPSLFMLEYGPALSSWVGAAVEKKPTPADLPHDLMLASWSQPKWGKVTTAEREPSCGGHAWHFTSCWALSTDKGVDITVAITVAGPEQTIIAAFPASHASTALRLQRMADTLQANGWEATGQPMNVPKGSRAHFLINGGEPTSAVLVDGTIMTVDQNALTNRVPGLWWVAVPFSMLDEVRQAQVSDVAEDKAHAKNPLNVVSDKDPSFGHASSAAMATILASPLPALSSEVVK